MTNVLPFPPRGATGIVDRVLPTGQVLAVDVARRSGPSPRVVGTIAESWRRLDWHTEILLSGIGVSYPGLGSWSMPPEVRVLVRVNEPADWLAACVEGGRPVPAVEVPRAWCWSCRVRGVDGRCPQCSVWLSLPDPLQWAGAGRPAVTSSSWRLVAGRRTLAQVDGVLVAERRMADGRWRGRLRVRAVRLVATAPAGWTAPVGREFAVAWSPERPGVISELVSSCPRCRRLVSGEVALGAHCEICGDRVNLWGGRPFVGHRRWGAHGGSRHAACGAMAPPTAMFCPGCGGRYGADDGANAVRPALDL